MRIGQKFTLWTVVVSTVIAALSVGVYYRLEMSEAQERLETLGMTTGPIIERDLNNYMMTRDQLVLEKTLRDLTSLKTIGNLWVIDKEGVIRVATDKSAIGMKLSPEDQRCQRCHEKGKRGLTLAGTQVFRWVQPVTNKPECHGCHQPSVKYNGVIVIDFDLRESAAHVEQDIYKGILVFIPSSIIMGFVMILLSKTLVVKRLNKAIEKMKSFKEGDYNASIPLEGNDEITGLEESFNEMAVMVRQRDSEKNELILKVSQTSKEWQETFDNITDLISIHDKDFNIIKCNAAFAKHMGLEPEEIINRKCYEVFHDICAPVKSCPHSRTLGILAPVTEDVSDPRTSKTFRVSTFPYYSLENDFIGTVHIAKDVTEEREKEARLIMNERLTSLGRMASGIAHEINNPLAAIAGCAEGLSIRVNQKRFDIDFFNNYLQIIMEEIIRCKNITSGMLSFVRESIDEKRYLNIQDTLDKTLEVIGFQGRFRNVGITKKYQDNFPDILGCEGELRQVFLAIITNALDAMEDCGTLTVETGLNEDDLVVKISDTGAGMSQEHYSRIFDPFFTTKSEKRGTGLGLSIAAKIIANHKGSIEVSTKEGEGATFTVNLPVSVQVNSN